VAPPPVLLWFRQDLRLQDNPALQAALAAGAPIVPVFIFDDEGEGRRPIGGASRWWLHHSLASLDKALRALGSRLILRRGRATLLLRELLAETGAGSVFWNQCYEPIIIQRDGAIRKELNAAGVAVRDFNSALLFEPHTIANKQGRPFQVFTPFWRHCLGQAVPKPVKLRAQRLLSPTRWPATLALGDLALLPAVRWDAGFRAVWQPGEDAARERLRKFLVKSLGSYAWQRNLPDTDGTSMLSPWLHFGEIGPRQIWAAVAARSRNSGVFPASQGEQAFLSELGWREFAHHLLYHFPHTPEKPMRQHFQMFPWADDPEGLMLRAWQQGRTGYPLVDAGMRQLWKTGWMHNRVRMVAASFLVKHLRLPWTLGATWFWDTLVDADLANNTLGWQWTAGCGADATPYFRIFAPVLQGQKFDAAGKYVRRWVPELAALPAKYIHCPWMAPSPVLVAAGVGLGENYPAPMVEHRAARNEALAALAQMRARNLAVRN
jgi:deoxyribodipyrimidine photo-lyase